MFYFIALAGAHKRVVVQLREQLSLVRKSRSRGSWLGTSAQDTERTVVLSPGRGGKAVALLTTASQNCVRAGPYNVYIDHCLLLILHWETVVTEGAETAKQSQKNHEFQ